MTVQEAIAVLLRAAAATVTTPERKKRGHPGKGRRG